MIELLPFVFAVIAIAAVHWYFERRLVDKLLGRQVALDKQHKALVRKIARTEREAAEIQARVNDLLSDPRIQRLLNERG